MTYLNNKATAATTTAQEKFLCGREKSALLLGAGFSALGGHLGTNIAGRSAHHASNLAEVMAHRGFQHGLLGQQIHPARQLSMKALMGPESLATYELARQAGLSAVEHAPNPIERAKYLQNIHGFASTQPSLEHAPIIDPIRQAVMHELAGTAPELHASNPATKGYGKVVNWLADHTQTGFETGAQKAVGAIRGIAPAATLAAVEPIPMAGHFAVNMTREGLSRTPQGQRFMKNELAKGLRGQMPGKAKSMAIDLMASPALLDARRAANSIGKGLSPEMAEMGAQQLDKFKTLGEAKAHITSLAQQHGVNKETVSSAVAQAKGIANQLPQVPANMPAVSERGVYRTPAKSSVSNLMSPNPSTVAAPTATKMPISSAPKGNGSRLLGALGGAAIGGAGGGVADEQNRPRGTMLGALAGAGAGAAGAHFLG